MFLKGGYYNSNSDELRSWYGVNASALSGQDLNKMSFRCSKQISEEGIMRRISNNSKNHIKNINDSRYPTRDTKNKRQQNKK